MRVAVILCLAAVAVGACEGSESIEIPPPVDAPFTVMTGGWLHTCAKTSTNHVYCWGWNRDGEIGDGSTADQPYAIQISPSRTFSVVTSGGGHSCAVEAGGAAYCWGLNLTGQIGDSSTTPRHSPTTVFGSRAFATITNGGTFTCGLATDSSAYCWGWNYDGELGGRPAETCLTPGGVEPCSRTPIAVGGGRRFIAISAGARHVCALAPDSTAFCSGNTTRCWGQNGNSQLGAQTTETCVSASGKTVAPCSHDPLPVNTNQFFGSIFAGGHHTCAITTGGKAYCWGGNANGQLGTGNTSGSGVPVLVANQP